MEGLYSTSQAQLAPSMLPGSTRTKKTRLESLTLKLLKERLRQDAHLLNRVLVAEVRMVETNQVEQCVSYKIFLGTLKVGGSTRSAWAFQCKAELMDDDKVGRWTKVLKDISSLPR